LFLLYLNPPNSAHVDKTLVLNYPKESKPTYALTPATLTSQDFLLGSCRLSTDQLCQLVEPSEPSEPSFVPLRPAPPPPEPASSAPLLPLPSNLRLPRKASGALFKASPFPHPKAEYPLIQMTTSNPRSQIPHCPAAQRQAKCSKIYYTPQSLPGSGLHRMRSLGWKRAGFILIDWYMLWKLNGRDRLSGLRWIWKLGEAEMKLNFSPTSRRTAWKLGSVDIRVPNFRTG
jgi:hypothetical protein